jgi:FemAB-related protein (PEP-CTERM system-associated)
VSLEVIPASLDDEARWDPFVQGQLGSTYAHLLAWGRVFTEVMGHAWHGLLASRGGDLEGVLPLVHVRSRLFGKYLVSMPFINYGGPVGSEEARALLASRARDLAGRLGVDLLELRNQAPLGKGESDLVRSDRKITVVLDLPDTPDELWKGLKAKVRSQVRRPMKEDMTPVFGPEHLGAFYGVFARNMRDLGTPVLPFAFFEALARHLPDHLVVCVIEHDGRAVAGGCGFVFGQEFELTWASSLREMNRLAPNMLLYWSLMEEALRRRLAVFNFGRCTPGGGTHRFKLQWGGRDQPLPWTQWSASGVMSTPSPDNAKFRAAVAVWQHLPLAVTNRVGPFLSRSIP